MTLKQEFIKMYGNFISRSISKFNTGLINEGYKEDFIKDLNKLLKEAQKKAFKAGYKAGYYRGTPRLIISEEVLQYFENWYKQQNK